jgi:hypothetical protein
MEDNGYEKLITIFMGVPVFGTLNISDHPQKDKILQMTREFAGNKYFNKHGFEIVMPSPYIFYKEPFLNKEFLKLYPNINTYGRLIFILKNKELLPYYKAKEDVSKLIESETRVNQDGDSEQNT